MDVSVQNPVLNRVEGIEVNVWISNEDIDKSKAILVNRNSYDLDPILFSTKISDPYSFNPNYANDASVAI